MNLNWIDRLIFVYCGIGVYVVAAYSWKPSCQVSTGFFIWMAIIISASRPCKRIARFDIGLEVIMTGWGFYELYDISCFINPIVLGFVIANEIGFVLAIIYLSIKILKQERQERQLQRIEQSDHEEGLLDREMRLIRTSENEEKSSEI